VSFHRYAVLLGTACAAGLVSGQAAHGQAAAPAQTIALKTLALNEALSLALDDAPVLGVYASAALASEAAVQQADRALNPTFDILVENALGTGYYSGFDRVENTFSFAQTIERGGDRAARVMLARRQGDRTQADGDIARQDILAEVAAAYLAAQQTAAELAVAEERLAIAREVAATVDRRVAAARDPLLAASRTMTQLAEAEIALDRARATDESTRRHLASYWGGAADFGVEPLAEVAAGGASVVAADGAPELRAAAAAEREADAAIAVEQARAKPNPTVSAGVRYFRDNSEAAFVVGVSVPLTFRDNNGGAIARASAEAQRARFETEALRRNLERQIASATSQMEIAADEVASLDRRMLPSAEQAVARARQGYEQGGFSYLDVLEAQRVLSAARLQRVSALASYHRARVALTRLLGGFAAGGAQ
jgi:cobalt-zinc-cadmium efflux system outer membrane protein